MPSSACILLMLMLFSHCGAGSEMKKVENLWQRVVSSQTTEEESRAAQELSSYTTQSHISFKTLVTDTQGREISYTETSPDLQIVSVRIQFFMRNSTFEGAPWKPKNLDNLYRLYQE